MARVIHCSLDFDLETQRETDGMSSLQDVLSTVPIFSFLGRDEIAAVAPLFVESIHQKGEYICREGEEGNTFHIILDGELEVFVGQDDSPRVLSILKKGDFFGEMVLLQGGKRTASVMVTRRAHLRHPGSRVVQQPVPEEPEGAGVLYPRALQAYSGREQGR